MYEIPNLHINGSSFVKSCKIQIRWHTSTTEAVQRTARAPNYQPSEAVKNINFWMELHMEHFTSLYPQNINKSLFSKERFIPFRYKLCVYWSLQHLYAIFYLCFFYCIERAKPEHYEIAPFKPLSGPSKVVSFIKWRLRVEKTERGGVYS